MPSLTPPPGSVPGGVLNIHKPPGVTSFFVVRKIKQILRGVKVGHCGTLDPMATGVLVVVFGKATSRSQHFMSQDKVYRAEMRLGIRTDTGDLTGRVLETSLPPLLDAETLRKVFEKFTGEIEQVPPMFSAIKWKGKKLYEYARKGIEIVRQPKKVTVSAIELLDLRPALVGFRVHCSKGTYVRTLAEDIGAALRVPAALSALVRERSGSFTLADSLDWDRVLRMSAGELCAQARPAPEKEDASVPPPEGRV